MPKQKKQFKKKALTKEYKKLMGMVQKEVKKVQGKDIEMKKWLQGGISDTVGQVETNVDGYFAYALEHPIPQGVGNQDRIGRSVTLKGMFIRFCLQQMSALTPRSKYRVEVWKSNLYFSNPDNFVADVYEPDSISAVIDANSSLNIQLRGTHKCIFSKKYTLDPDTVSGMTTLTNHKIFIKQNQKLEYAGGSTAPENNIFYYLVVLAYQGNKATSGASTLPFVPITAINTGAVFNAVCNSYYMDQ